MGEFRQVSSGYCKCIKCFAQLPNRFSESIDRAKHPVADPNKLIRKAKEKRSTTELLVSEIAYELGFEHPQSFSKLFKSKTHSSPLEFRASFN